MDVGKTITPTIETQMLVYSFMLVGVFFDVFTTSYGLTIPGIVETNVYVIPRMSDGTWYLWELFYIAANVGSSAFFINFMNVKHRSWFLAGPFMYGFIRLLAGFSNIGVIIGLLVRG